MRRRIRFCTIMSLFGAKQAMITTLSDATNQTKITRIQRSPESKLTNKRHQSQERWAQDYLLAIAVLEFYCQQTAREISGLKAESGDTFDTPKTIHNDMTEDVPLPLPCLVVNHQFICGLLSQLKHLQSSKEANLTYLQDKLSEITKTIEFLKKERSSILEFHDRVQRRKLAKLALWSDSKSNLEFEEEATKDLRKLLTIQSQKNDILSVKLTKLTAKRKTVQFKENFIQQQAKSDESRIKATTALTSTAETEALKLTNNRNSIAQQVNKHNTEKTKLIADKQKLNEKLESVKQKIKYMRSKFKELSDSPSKTTDSVNSGSNRRVAELLQKKVCLKETVLRDLKAEINKLKVTQKQSKIMIYQLSEKENQVEIEIQAKTDQLAVLNTAIKESQNLDVPDSADRRLRSQYSIDMSAADFQNECQSELEELKHQLKNEALVAFNNYEGKSALLKSKIELLRRLIDKELNH